MSALAKSSSHCVHIAPVKVYGSTVNVPSLWLSRGRPFCNVTEMGLSESMKFCWYVNALTSVDVPPPIAHCHSSPMPLEQHSMGNAPPPSAVGTVRRPSRGYLPPTRNPAPCLGALLKRRFSPARYSYQRVVTVAVP